MRVKNEDLLKDSGAVSLGASVNLAPVWLGHIVNYSIQLTFTGTPSGSFKLQATNDIGSIDSQSDTQKQAALANWTDVADSSITVSAAGNIMWDVQNAGYNWVRVAYTRTGSTGSVTVARCYVKGV